MRIGTREINREQPPYIIAELGVNHDGSLERALELTRLAAEAGADAVKLQYFEAGRLMSRGAQLAAYQKAAGEVNPFEMLRRLEMTIDDMAKVVSLAHDLGIHAIVTVFSPELVEIADREPRHRQQAAD
jgi:sialic acid synthase SpsE